jgi:hypothetical protein
MGDRSLPRPFISRRLYLVCSPTIHYGINGNTWFLSHSDVMFSAVKIVHARIGAEQTCRSAPQPRVRLEQFLSSYLTAFNSQLSPLVHRHLIHRRKIPVNESPNFPPSHPPAFPFLSYFPQRRSTLSRSRATPVTVRPQYNL